MNEHVYTDLDKPINSRSTGKHAARTDGSGGWSPIQLKERRWGRARRAWNNLHLRREDTRQHEYNSISTYTY